MLISDWSSDVCSSDLVDAVKARETNVELKLDCLDVLTGFETEVAVGIVEAVAEGGADAASDLLRAHGIDPEATDRTDDVLGERGGIGAHAFHPSIWFDRILTNLFHCAI